MNYGVCGTSLFRDKIKLRWGRDVSRIVHLVKTGHPDVRMFELDDLVDTKLEAVLAICQMPEMQEEPYKTVVEDYLKKHNKVKPESSPTATLRKKAPKLNLENDPF
jgi:hypothetical protein